MPRQNLFRFPIKGSLISQLHCFLYSFLRTQKFPGELFNKSHEIDKCIKCWQRVVNSNWPIFSTMLGKVFRVLRSYSLDSRTSSDWATTWKLKVIFKNIFMKFSEFFRVKKYRCNIPYEHIKDHFKFPFEPGSKLRHGSVTGCFRPVNRFTTAVL